MLKSFLHLRKVSLLALLVAACGTAGLPASVQAQAAGAKAGNAAAKKAEKLDELATLKQAKLLLEGANHDYQGHRAKAVHLIHEAIQDLEHHHKAAAGAGGAKANPQAQAAKAAAKAAHASAAKGAKGVHEAQATSDQQLQSAQQLLAKVQAELSHGKHPHAQAHVQNAMKELQTALSVK